MLLFGHRFIKSENFYHVTTIDALAQTPSNSIIFVEFDEGALELIEYLKQNNIDFVLDVHSIKEAIYAYNLGASFITCKGDLASELQKVAETYLFDAKIVVHVNSEEEIEKYAKMGIDGVVFRSAIIEV